MEHSHALTFHQSYELTEVCVTCGKAGYIRRCCLLIHETLVIQPEGPYSDHMIICRIFVR